MSSGNEPATVDPFTSPFVLSGADVVLREFTDDDLPAMVELFDDPEVAYRTQLAAPFDLAAARDFLALMRRTRAKENRLHLAITRPGEDVPLGVVYLRLTGCISGYVVGKAHRGQGLAVRAGRVIVDFALGAAGLPHVVLHIESDNHASVAVARALGARLSDAPPVVAVEKDRTVARDTWIIEPSPGR